MTWGLLFVSLSLTAVSWAQPAPPYSLVREYSGQTFFNGWDFYGNEDNLTWGNVSYLDASDAASQKLAYINDAGRAIIKVDNTTNVVSGNLRNSVRITTQQSYGFGSMWILDVTHLPYGCSVWPAYWTKGPLWPDDGEIDIMEAINLMTANEGALHTLEGCTISPAVNSTLELGNIGSTDCSTGSGCVIGESKANSYGTTFNTAGGGVWATSFDLTGIYMWFWSRADIPASITSLTSTSPLGSIADWGTPSMVWPSSSCNMPTFFGEQQIILDITLCGVWAGVPGIYQSTCAGVGTTGICYNDSVIGPGSPRFDEAYFEINYLRTYTNNVTTQASISASPTAASANGPIATTLTLTYTPGATTKSGAGEALWKINRGTSLFAGLVGVGVLLGVQLVL
ncbi:glycoside hydrolase family 16 protein [Jaapia argillacea MUCL 33604]|uniref:Glycoside hydrolase family 16 protein n=1 Tax=Jaapia argillacea MUCL 33604 TaxID=933084 RepID=A0A067PZW7_9AGAM|nr:glycoside hydrolase family 16 protein [Jaapia argillacea MUCL 33604]